MDTEPEASRQRGAEPEAESAPAETGFFALLRHNKKWWLTPIVLVVLVLLGLVALSATQTVPFIYQQSP